jgi:hypothetical protein
MLDLHKELVSALNTILPTYYEMTLTSNTKTPCISYMEITNVPETDSHLNGFTIGYSRIHYQVKVWGTSLADLQNYAIKIDNKLRSMGFKRTGTNEMYDNQSSIMQKIINYECLALENLKED